MGCVSSPSYLLSESFWVATAIAGATWNGSDGEWGDAYTALWAPAELVLPL